MIPPSSALLKALADQEPVPLHDTFFRAVSYDHITALLSAIGSKRAGGRYNVKDLFEVLYLTENPIAALLEIESVPTQRLGQAVRSLGYEASLAPSAKLRGAKNLAVFPEQLQNP